MGRYPPCWPSGLDSIPSCPGRRNIYLGALAAGLRKAQIDELYDDIVDYAELRPAIGRPLKTYSSGMFARLAFSISMHLEPDISAPRRGAGGRRRVVRAEEHADHAGTPGPGRAPSCSCRTRCPRWRSSATGHCGFRTERSKRSARRRPSSRTTGRPLLVRRRAALVHDPPAYRDGRRSPPFSVAEAQDLGFCAEDALICLCPTFVLVCWRLCAP